LIRLADRPHSVLPVQARAEADVPSQLFQYYLLDSTGFEPNVFTKIFPGVNDQAQLALSRARLRLRVHVGPVQLFLYAVERVVSDDAAVAQLDQLAALRGVSATERIGVGGPVVHLVPCACSRPVAGAQPPFVL